MDAKYPVTPYDERELRDRFSFHPADADKAARHEFIRDECFHLALHIKANTPPGREQSVALTKLQEVMMWANAAIALEKPPKNDCTPVAPAGRDSMLDPRHTEPQATS